MDRQPRHFHHSLSPTATLRHPTTMAKAAMKVSQWANGTDLMPHVQELGDHRSDCTSYPDEGHPDQLTHPLRA